MDKAEGGRFRPSLEAESPAPTDCDIGVIQRGQHLRFAVEALHAGGWMPLSPSFVTMR